MNRCLGRFLWPLCATLLVAGPAAAYEYDVRDPYLATVLGTPPEQQYKIEEGWKPDLRTYGIDLGKRLATDSDLASAYRFTELKFGLARQDGPAPLVVSIAGTGGDYETGKVVLVRNVLAKAGFHVLSLSSPTKPDFMAAASSTNVPGMTPYDAQDLYRVIQAAIERVRQDIQITDVYLTGYSLGGLDSAFVARLDAEQRKVGFKRVLLINPPVNLYTSVSNLDNILIDAGKKHPKATMGTVFNDIFDRLARKFHQDGKIDLGKEALYGLQEGEHAIPDWEVRAIIGMAFRFSAADLVFTSDALNRSGWVIPADENYSPVSDDLTLWYRRSLRWTFLDYFDRIMIPAWQARRPGDGREDIIRAVSLTGIGDWLRGASHVAVMHNDDDIILGPGDIDWLRDVFGARATVYPLGGHCGNMDHKDNVARMIGYFKGAW